MISMMIHANVSLFCSFTPKMGEGFSMFFVSWAKTSAFDPFLTQLQSQTQVCCTYVYIYIYVICQGDVNHLALVMSYRGGHSSSQTPSRVEMSLAAQSYLIPFWLRKMKTGWDDVIEILLWYLVTSGIEQSVFPQFADLRDWGIPNPSGSRNPCQDELD